MIFVKPIPAWLLDENFARSYVAGRSGLQDRANGFLRSYLFLIQYETDFNMAMDRGLIPSTMTWKEWLVLVEKKYNLVTTDRHCCSPRFMYGELRLSRINFLYRFLPRYKLRNLFRGYNYGNATYQGFIAKNFAWLIIAFIFVTLLLTAMQLGLETRELQNNATFHRASYGFSVFSIILPLATILYGIIASITMAVYHIRATLNHIKAEARSRPMKVQSEKDDAV